MGTLERSIISRGSIKAPVKPVSTTHSTFTSSVKQTVRIGSRAEVILPDSVAMAVKRISSFVTNSGEIKGVLRHRGMSYYQRGSSGITQKVFTGVRFDRHVASLLSRFKHNAKLLVIKLA